MDNREFSIAVVLTIIKEGRDFSDAFLFGIDSNKILEICSYALKKNYCVHENGRIVITAIGELFLSKYKKIFEAERGNIKPIYDKRCPRMSLDTIYLPKKI